MASPGVGRKLRPRSSAPARPTDRSAARAGRPGLARPRAV